MWNQEVTATLNRKVSKMSLRLEVETRNPAVYWPSTLVSEIFLFEKCGGQGRAVLRTYPLCDDAPCATNVIGPFVSMSVGRPFL